MTNPHTPSSRTQFAWKRCFAIGVFSASLMCAAQTQPLVDVQNWQPGQLTLRVVQNDPHDDVRKLIRQAKYPQALLLVNKGLATNPRDPQMRFWQGFIFEQLGQPDMAIQVYLALTQEYPELAEPNNNLGVLYAAKGDYPKAKAALEAALRANPNYATAHENMGDVLLNMSRQSYERAISINPSQRDAAKKIERLKPALTATQVKP
jgi:tetratricopeptide (TPR) repeat protein